MIFNDGEIQFFSSYSEDKLSEINCPLCNSTFKKDYLLSGQYGVIELYCGKCKYTVCFDSNCFSPEERYQFYQFIIKYNFWYFVFRNEAEQDFLVLDKIILFPINRFQDFIKKIKTNDIQSYIDKISVLI